MSVRDQNSEIATTMKASEFKAKCLKLMDDISENGGEIVITKNGRPVSRLVPYREKPKSLFGIDQRKIELIGNVVEPVDTVWEAETGHTRDGDV